MSSLTALHACFWVLWYRGLYQSNIFHTSHSDIISHNKVATQSSTYVIPGMRFDANNAVDGNLATCIRTHPIGTHAPDRTMWWKVDLGRAYNIYSINIMFKNYDGYGRIVSNYWSTFNLILWVFFVVWEVYLELLYMKYWSQ